MVACGVERVYRVGAAPLKGVCSCRPALLIAGFTRQL